MSTEVEIAVILTLTKEQSFEELGLLLLKHYILNINMNITLITQSVNDTGWNLDSQMKSLLRDGDKLSAYLPFPAMPALSSH